MTTTTTTNITVPAVPTNAEEAHAALRWCLTVLGEGFHPDNSGAEYIDFATEEFIFSPEQAIAFDAMIEGVFAQFDDPSAETLDLISPCYVCHRPIYLGDDPGEVFVDGDKPVPNCSDACAEIFFAVEED